MIDSREGHSLMLNTAGANTWLAFAGMPSAGSLSFDIVSLVVTVLVCEFTIFTIFYSLSGEVLIWQADLKRVQKLSQYLGLCLCVG